MKIIAAGSVLLCVLFTATACMGQAHRGWGTIAMSSHAGGVNHGNDANAALLEELLKAKLRNNSANTTGSYTSIIITDNDNSEIKVYGNNLTSSNTGAVTGDTTFVDGTATITNN